MIDQVPLHMLSHLITKTTLERLVIPPLQQIASYVAELESEIRFLASCWFWDALKFSMYSSATKLCLKDITDARGFLLGVGPLTLC